MIIKTIFSKISIHPFFYVVSFLALLTGNFKSFCIFTSILIVHECGHILGGLLYHWNIEKICLYPFGALTIFKEHLNKPIKEEFIIVLMGPIFQIFFYLFFKEFYDYSILKSFHYGLLCFNLLPIVPLDGSKIMSLIIQKFCSYLKSIYVITLISIIVIVFMIMIGLKESFVFVLIIFLLIDKVVIYFKNRYSIFYKFLLERIMYPISFKKRKIIYGDSVKKIMRDKKHLFYINKNYYTEQEILKKRFDFKRKRW